MKLYLAVDFRVDFSDDFLLINIINFATEVVVFGGAHQDFDSLGAASLRSYQKPLKIRLKLRIGNSDFTYGDIFEILGSK